MLNGLLPRLAVLGALLGTAFFALAPAFAQAPPPVPALPDTERRIAYSLTAQTGPFSIPFALYGDSTDYSQWLTVSLCTAAVLNPCTVLTGVTDWTLSSATGPLATIPRPITDATITLTSARTGTLQITGARRPRRTSQFAENRGVAARDLNQVITDLTAQNREDWDAMRRTIQGQPGETISSLQPAASRAGGILCWDATGLLPLTCAAGSSGTANVVGPNVSVVGHIATFGNTSGTLLLDGGLVGSGDVTGPASGVIDHVPTFSSTTGKVLKDSGVTIQPAAGAVLGIAANKQLIVSNTLTLAGTDSTVMTFPTTSATIARTDAANVFTGHQTIEGVTTTGATGTGKLVFDTAPVLGAVTATTINGLTISATTGTATLAVSANKQLTINSSLTLAGVDSKTLTVNNSGTLAGGDGFTLAIAAGKTATHSASTTFAGVDGKTLTVNNSGTIAGGDAFTLAIAAAKTLTVSNSLTFTGTDGTSFAFPGTSDTVATIAAVQTLTNKTLTAPTINGGTHQAITNLGIRSTGTGAFDLVLANTENLTAQRTLTLTVNNAPRTVSLSGNITTAADFTTAGGNAITLTTTGSTGVTLPTSGTLATRDTSQTFSGSNIFSALTQFTDIKLSSGKIFPTADSTTALQVTKADGTTRIMNFDTTNARVGINKTPGAFDFDVNGAANIGGALTFATTTITGLTNKAAPDAANDYVIIYDSAGTAIKKATVGAVGAAGTAGVSSLNGLTGGLSIAQGTGIAVSAGGSSVTVGLTTARQTLPTVQKLLSGSGTYTTPANVLYITIRMIGAGGGGGGGGTTGGNGGAGGNTCWNTTGAACTTPVYQAGGGSLGFASGSGGGAGGTIAGTGTCDIAIAGGNGTAGIVLAQTSGGTAGGSALGGNGGGGPAGAGATAGATNSGGGGGGGSNNGGSAGGSGGGAGAYCEVQIGTPAATYTYAVGAAGTAGTAGTSGAAGAAGGSGGIWVVEHYGT